MGLGPQPAGRTDFCGVSAGRANGPAGERVTDELRVAGDERAVDQDGSDARRGADAREVGAPSAGPRQGTVGVQRSVASSGYANFGPFGADVATKPAVAAGRPRRGRRTSVPS
jgi:hypothetical protein